MSAATPNRPYSLLPVADTLGGGGMTAPNTLEDNGLLFQNNGIFDVIL